MAAIGVVGYFAWMEVWLVGFARSKEVRMMIACMAARINQRRLQALWWKR
jgi:hypothetical protein